MGPGLAKILELINASPDDSMLVDRYLVLAADMPEFERAEATLELAKSLLPQDPRRSMEISWMVYKSSLRDNESLEMIARALEALGKQTKGEMLRSEMMRLNNETLSDDARKLARLTIEEHVTSTLAGRDVLQWSLDDKTQQSDPSMAQFDLGGSFENEGPSLNGLAAPMATLRMDEPSRDEVRAARGRPAQVVAQLNDEPKETHGSIARVSVNAPGAGIPEAIPRKEPSRHPANEMELDRQSARRDGGEEVPRQSIPEQVQGPRPELLSREEAHKRLALLIAAEKWDAVYRLLAEEFVSADDKLLLPLFQRYKLERIDLRFAEFWIDILLAAHQERRALRYIIQKLSEEPYLAWARMVYPKLDLIRKSLDLTAVDWREADGVFALRDRAARMQPRRGCYWAS